MEIKNSPHYFRRTSLAYLLILTLSGCTGVADGVSPVKNFELDRYLGTWYEIARYPNRFQKGCVAVTADYSLRDDGKIRVVGPDGLEHAKYAPQDYLEYVA